MARLLLACGCDVSFVDGKPPACPTHGRQRVIRTVGMPKPTFRGHVRGPRAQPMDLTPFKGPLVESES